jgi:predicted PurR-regulated permease PerM
MTAAGVDSPLTPLARLLLTVASTVVVLAGMRAAAPVLGPIFIALLISIAWSPGSIWLRSRGWPGPVAALTGIVLGVIGIALFVLLVWTSLVQLQDRLPEYQPRVEALMGEITARLAAFNVDTSRIRSAEIFQPGAIVGYALRFIRRLTETAGNISVLVLLMAFMMIEGVRYPQKLRDALASSSVAVERANQFGDSMRSYVVINSIFGLVAAVVNTALLLVLGVDFAVLWGVLSFLLSFVPNVGFLIALVPPTLLALLQFGLGRAIIVAGGFIVINFFVDSVVKPRFVGESLDLSPLVVVISLIFWGWLLGPLGALLAVPLSIGARFLLESFEESRWLAHLMSDRGPSVTEVQSRPPIVGDADSAVL